MSGCPSSSSVVCFGAVWRVERGGRVERAGRVGVVLEVGVPGIEEREERADRPCEENRERGLTWMCLAGRPSRTSIKSSRLPPSAHCIRTWSVGTLGPKGENWYDSSHAW